MTENQMVIPGPDHPAYQTENPPEDDGTKQDREYDRMRQEQDDKEMTRQ